jgi:hypothetical protein
MPVFEIPVTRIGYGCKTIKVAADTKEEAERLAMEKAGDESFLEHDADYEVEGPKAKRHREDDDGEEAASEKRRQTLEKVAELLGLEYEDGTDGCNALIERAKDVTGIKVCHAWTPSPVMVDARRVAKGWVVMQGSMILGDDLEFSGAAKAHMTLPVAINLAKRWHDKHMKEGIKYAYNKLSKFLKPGDYTVGVGLCDETCYSDEPPGPKPTIFIYLKGELTEEIRKDGPHGHWRFVYRGEAMPVEEDGGV